MGEAKSEQETRESEACIEVKVGVSAQSEVSQVLPRSMLL